MKAVVVSALAISMLMLGALSGCSSQGSMTCAEFGAKDGWEHMKIVDNVIREHGLDPTSNSVAAAQIRADIYIFCGIPDVVAINQKQSPATKNLAATIGSGINWKKYSD